MTGDEKIPAKPQVGDLRSPISANKDGFYRGLDNKIYHDKPHMVIRLAQLKDDAKRGMTVSAWPLITPLAVFASAGLTFLATKVLSEYEALGFYQELLPILLFLVLLAVACLPFYIGVMAILNSRYNRHYKQASWYLYNTDFPVLVANEQFSLRILEETKDMPILKWTGAPAPTSFEDYIWFSACYRNAICKCMSGRQLQNSQSGKNNSIPLPSLRHGSCLFFLGTGNAKALARIGSCFSIFSCGFTGLFAIPLLVVGVLRDAERRGNLAAICDFFIGKCDVEICDLKPPG